ncbi:MAG: stage II sporulation protein R, partial [Clostridia bacterium]
FYDALKVEIGKAEGRNWWCVMFPSLCFVDISSGIVPEESKEDLQNVLSDEEYAIISDNYDYGIKFKFKLLEFFGKSNLIVSNK